MFYERDTTDQILSLARVTTLGRLRAGLSYLLEAHGFRYYVFTCHTVESDGACTAVLHNLPSRKEAAPASVDNVIVNDPLAQYAINETLPMDWRHRLLAVNSGRPILEQSPRCAYSRRLGSLLESLDGQGDEPRRGGFLTRLLGS